MFLFGALLRAPFVIAYATFQRGTQLNEEFVVHEHWLHVKMESKNNKQGKAQER